MRIGHAGNAGPKKLLTPEAAAYQMNLYLHSVENDL